MNTDKIERTELEIFENDLRMIRKIEGINESMEDKSGCIIDSDTILKDLVDENDLEFSGFSQDVFNIYKRSHDKAAVRQLFYEFTGMEFNEYLEKCIEESGIL